MMSKTKSRFSELLDAREAADYLKLNEQTVRRLARENEIPAFKVGGTWRFRKGSLDRWVEAAEQPAAQSHILIVDDERAVRVSLRRALEPEGFAVSTASDGLEAMRQIEVRVPDLIILDLQMPEMSGPEVLEAVRELHEDLPVIVLTAYPDSDLMEKALEYSPITLLSKPSSLKKVVRAVYTLLGQLEK